MTTTTMIRKSPRKPNMTESSSCEKTAPSKAPKDVLALGQHLVSALNLEDSVDTLGRWMAHHLAELLAEVEKCRKVSDRKAAEDRAMSAILRIWEHRQQLPGKAYPLSQYQKAANVLTSIHLHSNQFHAWRGSVSNLGLTLEVCGATSRLALFAIVDLLPERKCSLNPAAVAQLEAEEKEYIKAIEGVYKLFNFSSQAPTKNKKTRTADEIDLVDLRRMRLEILDELSKDIEKLKESLIDDPVKPVSMKRRSSRKK